MRHEPNLRIESYRRTHPMLGAGPTGTNAGYFEIGNLRIISSGTGYEWEHVSVSRAGRCPTWDEMARVKALFWADDETVVEFHPRADKYIDVHPYCLHLWRQTGVEYRLPPPACV